MKIYYKFIQIELEIPSLYFKSKYGQKNQAKIYSNELRISDHHRQI